MGPKIKRWLAAKRAEIVHRLSWQIYSGEEIISLIGSLETCGSGFRRNFSRKKR